MAMMNAKKLFLFHFKIVLAFICTSTLKVSALLEKDKFHNSYLHTLYALSSLKICIVIKDPGSTLYLYFPSFNGCFIKTNCVYLLYIIVLSHRPLECPEIKKILLLYPGKEAGNFFLCSFQTCTI